jgi:hypothetical protein
MAASVALASEATVGQATSGEAMETVQARSKIQ